MSGYFTESNYENAVLQLLNEDLGYTYVYGPDVERDYHSPLYEDVLLPSLQRINKNLPMDALTEAIYKLKNFETGTLLQKNMVFMDYLQNGVPVKYYDKGEERSTLVYLVDFKNPASNEFTVANQWTFIENSEKRPDVILFVNGLPLVIVELKSPSREETDASAAYRQLRNYMYEIPSMFIYNAVCVMSDLTTSKAGTITSGEDRFMEWKTTDGSYENTQHASFDTFFVGLFEKTRFLDIVKNFICFNVDGQNTFKILAGYHQYFAVKKAIESTKHATVTDGKGGVFWHTQGSGKSLSMVFYAHYLQEALESPTIVVITDRNDLDDQLYGQFARCKDFLRQTPQHAESRKNLKELLANRQANGIIFTTMQKFEESNEALSERRNIIVMADEAHRGQYGLNEKVVVKQKDNGEVEAKTVIGTARIIRDTLPNATYIGFTGTPISTKDRSTREVFGDYIDIYDMTQAVEDGATRPVYYESRVIHLKLDENTLHLIDNEYDIMADNADPYVIEKSKKELGQMEAILGADQTINSLVNDILDHYENYRENILTGKAMIVAYSRPIAMKIYKRILELRPAWTEKIAVVMTQGNNDPEEWREIIGNKAHKDDMARKFKDNNSPLKIAIVVDMWLTGFDVPSLATMYVYKPMLNAKNRIAEIEQEFLQLNPEQHYFEEYYASYSDVPTESLDKLSSQKLLALWMEFEQHAEHETRLGLLQKLSIMFRFNRNALKLFLHSPELVIPYLQSQFYSVKRRELEVEKQELNRKLEHYAFDAKMDELTQKSLRLFRAELATRYHWRNNRRCFEKNDFRRNSEEFTREYPVVLSTTYSIKGTLSIDHIYDYLIVDEASQVDLATGVLAFSCARNIVIVGDLKQLPNVLTEDDIRTSDAIWQKYSLDERYRFSTHSLLSSALEIWQDAPVTLLREHYRCHPKIINFCNQKFYHGQLIVMTKDHDEPDVLTMYRTTAGNHARGHINQRQIDVIQREVLPRLHQQNFQSIGIITPYRDQVTAIRKQLGDTYEVDTVHKFQGREQDAIILTSVDNVITDFVDDPHKIRVGLWIADNKERFDYMKQHKTEIEAAMGMALSWERLDNKKSSLICTYIKGLDFKNQENYPELMNKSIDLVVKMRDVLKEYVLAEL